MRIAFDARYLSHGLVGGVHTYTANVLRNLLAVDTTNHYVLWADRKRPFELSNLPANAELRLLPWQSGFSSVRNDRLIGTAMVRAGADVAHFPANVGLAPAWLPRVITLHDAINVLPLTEIIRGHKKDLRTIATMSYLHAQTRRSLVGDPLVLTVSEHARREILRHTALAPERVRVVYSAPEARFRRLADDETAAFGQSLGVRKRVIAADAIKNPLAVLAAYRALPDELRSETSLVFFSRRQPESAVVTSAADGESLLLLQPSSDDLVRLFNLADVFVFPSWYEGFGLPVLEAMACGAPVITSERGSLPEVAGPAGIVVAADDMRGLTMALGRVLSDPERAQTMRRAGLAWSARFTWDATARGVMAAYEDAYRLSQPGVAPVRLVAA
ncbi:MAG: glycosyltransferase family 1 protein [Chloroflexi bacterium]|nr:MAG: glycosyltransferase family 1 protein [Chloroflexota bacterium]